jgi:hypothetical protein
MPSTEDNLGAPRPPKAVDSATLRYTDNRRAAHGGRVASASTSLRLIGT